MGMRIGTEMPRLEGATEWFGGTQASAEMEAKGYPTLVHFWSMSCGMCKENMPRLAEWREGLREQGLRVFAVHMPRYETDTDVEVWFESCLFLMCERAKTLYQKSYPLDCDQNHRQRGFFCAMLTISSRLKSP